MENSCESINNRIANPNEVILFTLFHRRNLYKS